MGVVKTIGPSTDLVDADLGTVYNLVSVLLP